MGGKDSKPVVQATPPVSRSTGDEKSTPASLKKKTLDKKRDVVVAHTFRAKKELPASAAKKGKLSGKLDETLTTHQRKMEQGMDGDPLLKELIKLPEGEELNDWLGVNTIHFFNIASMVYGTILPRCTGSSCPETTAGSKYQYYWADADGSPRSVAAREYMSRLFDWIETQIADPAVFPVDDGAVYPENYQQVVGAIFKRLFRVYAHVYYSHFEQVKELGAESHLNSSFQHFAYFVLEFHLIPEEELRPLKKLIAKLVPGYAASGH